MKSSTLTANDFASAQVSGPFLSVDNVSVSLPENAPEGAIAGADADVNNATGPITFSLVSSAVDGSSQALFAIDSDGQISLTAAGAAFIDFETTNSYALTVKASDGVPAHDLTKTVTINLVDIAPDFTSGTTGSIAENSPTNTVAYDADATDGGGTLTYSLSKTGDNLLFNINASTGEVTFKESPDFETRADADGNNVYDIIVHANDGTNDTTQAIGFSQHLGHQIGQVSMALRYRRDSRRSIRSQRYDGCQRRLLGPF